MIKRRLFGSCWTSSPRPESNVEFHCSALQNTEWLQAWAKPARASRSVSARGSEQHLNTCHLKQERFQSHGNTRVVVLQHWTLKGSRYAALTYCIYTALACAWGYVAWLIFSEIYRYNSESLIPLCDWSLCGVTTKGVTVYFISRPLNSRQGRGCTRLSFIQKSHIHITQSAIK